MHAWEGCVPGTPTHRDRAAEVAWERAELGGGDGAWQHRRRGSTSSERRRKKGRGVSDPHSVCSHLCCWLFGAEVWAGACTWVRWQLVSSRLSLK